MTRWALDAVDVASGGAGLFGRCRPVVPESSCGLEWPRFLLPNTHALRKRAKRDMAVTPRRGRRQAVSTTGAACGNAVARRGYFGVPVWAKRAKDQFEL